MLDDFKNEQPIIYKTLLNSIKNNKLSHAYLFETNGYNRAFDFVLSFVKFLLCPNNYSNNSNCSNCSQCDNIDASDFLEVKIIEAEGQWIKKNQLDDLQYEFSKKAFIGNKRVYIIKDAEKLNVSSANSLLKFLEEPEEGIIAILLVENSYQVLNTISSRCQKFSFINFKDYSDRPLEYKIASILYDDKKKINEYIIDEKNIEKIKKVIEFALYFEKNRINTLLFLNKIWNPYFKEKDELYNALTILMLLYKDALNLKILDKIEIFSEYYSDILKISNENENHYLTHKINVIMDMREKIKFNMNSNLLMDKLIINLDRGENI